jgi:hypothetical protein
LERTISVDKPERVQKIEHLDVNALEVCHLIVRLLFQAMLIREVYTISIIPNDPETTLIIPIRCSIDCEMRNPTSDLILELIVTLQQSMQI